MRIEYGELKMAGSAYGNRTSYNPPFTDFSNVKPDQNNHLPKRVDTDLDVARNGGVFPENSGAKRDRWH